MDLTQKKQCSRCPRVELIDISIEEVLEMAKRAKSTEPPFLVIRIEGQEAVKFAALCTPCQGIVARHLEQVAKRPEKQSSLREASDTAA